MTQASTDHIGVADAAAELGVSTNSIRRWFDDRSLDGFVTPGGQRRIWRRSVEALRDEWRQSGPGEAADREAAAGAPLTRSSSPGSPS